MAKQGSRNQVGELNVKVDADTSGLKSGLKEAEQVTKTTAENIQTANAGVNDSFLRVGESIKGQTEGLRKLQSAVSAVAGIWTGFIGVLALATGTIAALTAALDSQIKKWAGYTEAVDKAAAATERHREISAQLNKELRDAQFSPSVDVQSIERARAELDELDSQIAILEDKLAAVLSGPGPHGGGSEFRIGKELQDAIKKRQELSLSIEGFNKRVIKQQELDEIDAIKRANEARLVAQEVANRAFNQIQEEQRRIEDARFAEKMQREREAFDERMRRESEIAAERAKREAEASAAAAAAFQRSFSEATRNLQQELRAALNLDRLVIASERTRDILELMVRQGRGRG